MPDKGSLNDVFQFPDIARPVIIHELINCSWRKRRGNVQLQFFYFLFYLMYENGDCV